MYLECWVISIFLTCFRRDAPYLFESNRVSGTIPQYIGFPSHGRSPATRTIPPDFGGSIADSKQNGRVILERFGSINRGKGNVVPGTVFAYDSDLPIHHIVSKFSSFFHLGSSAPVNASAYLVLLAILNC